MSRTFKPDDAILDVIDDPDAVTGCDLGRAFEQGDETEALAVQADGHAMLELDLDDLGLVGRELGPRDELEDVVLGRVVELLDPASLRGAAPQVVVDRVGGDLGGWVDPIWWDLTGMPCSRA